MTALCVAVWYVGGYGPEWNGVGVVYSRGLDLGNML